MSRIVKFKRMLKYQTHRVEMIKQQIAIEQNEIQTLQQQFAILTDQMEQIQETSVSCATSVAAIQLCELKIMETQKAMNTRKAEMADAEAKRDDLLHSYHEEERKLKAWEKLISRETVQWTHARLRFEQRQADELHLLTKFSGETR